MSEFSLRKDLQAKLANYRLRPIVSEWFIGDGNGNTYVDFSDLNTIYVRNSKGIVKTVYNQRVPNVPDMPVRIGIDPEQPRLEQVIDYVQAYATPPYPSIPPGISKILGWPGIETLWVRPEQILPWLVRPNASSNFAIDIYSNIGYSQGQWVIKQNNNADTLSLISYVPSIGAIFALVSLNADGTYSVTTPSVAATSLATLSNANIPPFEFGKQPVCLVRLYSGQDKIRQEFNYTDIIDPRWIISLGGIGTAQWGHISGLLSSQVDLWNELISKRGGHTHGLARWSGFAGETVFELPDLADVVEEVCIAGVFEDPFVYSLSADKTQIILDTGLASDSVVTANYVIAQV